MAHVLLPTSHVVSHSTSSQGEPMVNNGTAYLLWCTFIFGIGGIHRFYLGKPVSGFIYLFTFGLCGLGQLIDIALIPSMVKEQNWKYRALSGSTSTPFSPPMVVNIGEDYHYRYATPQSVSSATVAPTPERLDIQVLKICRERDGATLCDCVIETGAETAEMKATIHRLSVDGLLTVDNRASDGAVIYRAI